MKSKFKIEWLPLIVGLLFCQPIQLQAQTLSAPSWSKKLSARTVFFEEGWAREFLLKKPAYVVAMLQLSVNTNWEDAAHPAALLSIAVDGRLCSHLVTYAGKEYHPYEVHLGLVLPGEHTLEVLLADTNQTKTKIRIVNVQLEGYEENHEQYPIFAHAPILFGRKEMRTTDVPLVLAYRADWAGAGSARRIRSIEYTMVFSNEDGGTPPVGLVHYWGRYTDIEWIYRVELQTDGRKRAQAFFQGAEHKTLPFRGGFENEQPTLQVVTSNNMLSDTLTTKLRFSLPPLAQLPDEGPRERLMFEAPWTWQVSAREARRERGSVPDSFAVSDLRQYAFIEFAAQPLDSARAAGGYFVARYRNHDLEYSSNLGSPRLIINSNQSIVRQTAMPLPMGTKPEDLVRLDFVANERGGPIALTEIFSIFSLDEQDLPRSWRPGWRGRVELQPGERTRFYVEGFQLKRAKIMRLAEDWYFKPDPWLQGSAEKWGEDEIHESLWPKVRIGDSWEEQGFSGYRGVAWYRTKFRPETSWRGEKLWLVFGKVEGEIEVWVNNKRLSLSSPTHMPSARIVEVTTAIVLNKENNLTLRVTGKGNVVGKPIGISNIPEAILLEAKP